MIKAIAILKRKDGLTLEEFSSYWRDNHGPMFKRTWPKIVRYVQNHAAKLPGGGEPSVDGVAEIWFENLREWREYVDFYFSEEGKIIRDDENRFIDTKNMIVFISEEKFIKD